jgi:hypothetical protein
MLSRGMVVVDARSCSKLAHVRLAARSVTALLAVLAVWNAPFALAHEAARGQAETTRSGCSQKRPVPFGPRIATKKHSAKKHSAKKRGAHLQCPRHETKPESEAVPTFTG